MTLKTGGGNSHRRPDDGSDATMEEKGIFDRETGTAFLTNILEQGGSQNAMDLFINFRGRKPTIDALLRHNGIAA